MNRRLALPRSLIAILATLMASASGSIACASDVRLATFSADVTIPLGHACMGGGIRPAREVVDPLEARGIVLLGADVGRPLVIVAVDWCEIRNEAHDAWREALAAAASTDPARVLISSIHQHDAPVADLRAEALLKAAQAPASVCDVAFHARAVERAAQALRDALPRARPVTRVGTGKAKVEQVASNRRFLLPDGRPSFGRTSATRDEYARSQPEGTIDPWLRALSFWDGDAPLAVLNVYAVHPMSLYGQGKVSADFVGDARRRRQRAEPDVFTVYLSGCSGNVTAGKYNDGSPANRAVLAGRMEKAMALAWKSTEKHPLSSVGFRSVPLVLAPRDDEGFSPAALKHRLETDPKPFGRCLAAMGLSWRERCDAGRPMDVPAVKLGPATILLLPGESYVEYQLFAQQARPGQFVVALGYGECGTGYVPTQKAVMESDTNLSDWCWVAPGAEARMKAAITEALRD